MRNGEELPEIGGKGVAHSQFTDFVDKHQVNSEKETKKPHEVCGSHL